VSEAIYLMILSGLLSKFGTWLAAFCYFRLRAWHERRKLALAQKYRLAGGGQIHEARIEQLDASDAS
jgi:hypothetical protein